MVWVIALSKLTKPEFESLRWRLLLFYLSAMATILAVSALGVYAFFTRSLYQQLDDKLLTLAQAAAPSLAAVRNEGVLHLGKVDELAWTDLFKRDQQSLEWFTPDGKLLAKEGSIDLALSPQVGSQTFQEVQIHTVTIPVYKGKRKLDPNRPPQLVGYIRASQSTDEVESLKRKLRWGLSMGGLMALGFVGLSGIWLTRRATKPVEQSLQQLKQFTADASHELRSPLTVIKTSIEVIQNHPERIHPSDTKKIRAIASATNQMARLVGDLLLLARSDVSPVAPAVELTPVALDRILLEVINLLEPQAQAKRIQVAWQLLNNLTITGNTDQLTRLFTNLLENALQYTPSGGSVAVSMVRLRRSVVVKVEDSGIGIAAERLPFVFQRFWRADRARSRRAGGLGLGLAIAQAIAQHHGGKITVSSQVGIGSCFRVHLPLGRSSLADAHF